MQTWCSAREKQHRASEIASALSLCPKLRDRETKRGLRHMRARGFMQSHLPLLMLCPIPSWLYGRRRRRSRYLIDSHRCSICDYGVTDHDEGGKGATLRAFLAFYSIPFQAKVRIWPLTFFRTLFPKTRMPTSNDAPSWSGVHVRPTSRSLRFPISGNRSGCATGDSPPAPGLPPSFAR